MTAENNEKVNKNKKKINRFTLWVFFFILTWDKFKLWLLGTSVAKRVKKMIAKIRDMIDWYIKHPDDYFDDKWETNEYYPFVQDEYEQFKLKIRQRWFRPVLTIFIISAFYAIVLAYFYDKVNDFVTHTVVIITGVTSLIVWQKQQLIIDVDNEVYVIIWYNTIIVNDSIHNVYLRLHELRGSPADKPYYQLIIQAAMLPAVSITRLCKEVDRIRRIGHILAEKININFFEYEDVSHNHIIRYWPLFPTDDDLTNISPPPKTDFVQSKTLKGFYSLSSDLDSSSSYGKMVPRFKLSDNKSSDTINPKTVTILEHKHESVENVQEIVKEKVDNTEEEKETTRKRKPLAFFKKIFPSSSKHKNSTSSTNLEEAGPSTSKSSNYQNQSDAENSNVTIEASNVDSSEQKRKLLRDYNRKIKSGQALSSETLSLSSFSELSSYSQSSGSEKYERNIHSKSSENEIQL